MCEEGLFFVYGLDSHTKDVVQPVIIAGSCRPLKFLFITAMCFIFRCQRLILDVFQILHE